MNRIGEKKHNYLWFFFVIVLLVTVAIRFAEPVKDSDPFWHLAYGKYHVENKTLIPDHSIYSWTPASNETIYCSWLADVLIYRLHQIGGLTALFAFRYLCVLVALLILSFYTIKSIGYRHPITYLILMIYTLASFGATFIKHEILSMVFMAAVSFIYFTVKTNQGKGSFAYLLFLYPVIFLLWVNIHGVFIFGFSILIVIAFGESVNYFFQLNALPVRTLRYLFVSIAASCIALLINPYGVEYHFQLFQGLMANDKALNTVIAYATLFDAPVLSPLSPLRLWSGMLIVIVLIAIYSFKKNRRVDWALICLSIFLAWLSSRLLRTFYFWAPFWSMTLVYLISRTKWPRWRLPNTVLKYVVSIGFLFCAMNTIYECVRSPYQGRYLGFGIGYMNPVLASNFLKKNKPGKFLYNSYDIGGYLLYDLYPEYQVFCDARYFPYQDWYKKYWDFSVGKVPLKEFEKLYPFDVAIVDYRTQQSPIMSFLRSPNWRPVYYGPVAMVFVKKDAEFKHDYRRDPPQRFDNVKNLRQMKINFYMAQNLDDYETAGYILELLKNKLKCQLGHKEYVKNCSRIQQGMLAYKRGEFNTALDLLNSINYEMTVNVQLALLRLRNWKCKVLIKGGENQKAFEQLEKTLNENPSYVDGLYNAGVLGYLATLSRSKKNNSVGLGATQYNITLSQRWKDYLKRLLILKPDYKYAETARKILDGATLSGNVPLAL